MARVVPLRDLQTLSAAALARLPGAVSVESDRRTVALLIPVRPAAEQVRVRFRQALARAKAARTPEEQETLDREVGP